MASTASATPARLVPSLRHLRLAAALATDLGHGDLDQLPRGHALRDGGLVRRHEDLRLVRIQHEADDIGAEGGAQVLRVALHHLWRLERRGERDDRDAVEGLDLVPQVRRPGRASPATALAQLAPRILELRLQRGDAIGERVGRRRTHRLHGVFEQVEAGAKVRIRPGAGERLDPTHARADAPLTGDHEAADLAAGAAVRAAA